MNMGFDAYTMHNKTVYDYVVQPEDCTYTLLHLWRALKSNEESAFKIFLKNTFDFWYVHGILNTLGLLQSNINFARDPKYS